MTIPETLAAIADERPNQPALVYRETRLSYSELDRLVSCVARGVASHGVEAGDRVALMGPNNHLYVAAYLGAMRAGASVITINPTFKPDEVRFMLEDGGVGLAIGFGPLAQVLDAARDGLAERPKLATVGQCPVAGDTTLEEWIAAGPDPFTSPSVPDSSVAAILYTSGTTGRPKGAMLTHHNILWDAGSCMRAIEFSEADTLLTVLPIFHSYAATVGVILPLLARARFVVLERFQPLEVLEICKAEGVTVLPVVPAMCGALLRVADEGPADALKTLRMCVSGGAPMPVELMAAFEKRFDVIVIEGDGPTECSPVTSVNPIAGARKPGSVGLPIPGVEMRIVDDDDHELPDGEVGEICVRGPNIMLGYLNQPEATAESIIDGWFHTGDLGKRDADGYFYIVDRKKDMILVGAMNVYPSEIEAVLRQHPGVAHAAVIGVPDDIRGERVKAVIVRAEGSDASAADITKHCRDRLANFKVPKEVVFVDALPMSLTGKVLKRELRDPHWTPC